MREILFIFTVSICLYSCTDPDTEENQPASIPIQLVGDTLDIAGGTLSASIKYEVESEGAKYPAEAIWSTNRGSMTSDSTINYSSSDSGDFLTSKATLILSGFPGEYLITMCIKRAQGSACFDTAFTTSTAWPEEIITASIAKTFSDASRSVEVTLFHTVAEIGMSNGIMVKPILKDMNTGEEILPSVAAVTPFSALLSPSPNEPVRFLFEFYGEADALASGTVLVIGFEVTSGDVIWEDGGDAEVMLEWDGG